MRKALLINDLAESMFGCGPTSKTDYMTHYNCKIEEADKRKMSPRMLERYLFQHLGCKPKTIRFRHKTTFTVEVLDDK